MMKRFSTAILILILGSQSVLIAEALPVRLKDIGKIIEFRDNQLIGYGLVVGLRGTGDSDKAAVTHASLRTMLGKLGVGSGGSMQTRNVASVIVTASLPPFVKPGQRIPVTVSSLGDATSLVGGMLLMTPLQGADLKTYAVAQGSLVVGGISEETSVARYRQNQTTAARIPDGAIVESEVPVTFSDQLNITIVLSDSNFITVSRAAEAIRVSGFPGAKAIDANTIKVPLEDLDSSDLVQTIAQLENVSIVPDVSSKVVINSRTGTVVIGEMVRLFPVALTHGGVSVRILESNTPGGVADTAAIQPPLTVEEVESKVIYLNPSATLSSLVNALNEIGVSPKDLISILQALKQSGALVATLEVI